MQGFAVVQTRHRFSRQRQRMGVVVGQMIGHPRQTGVHIAATQVFRADDFANRRFDQRRPTQKNGALVFHNDGFITHRRHIGATCGATAHDHRDLRNALRAHIGLVVKNPTKVVAVRKHIVLVGQIGTARVHQINTWQAVLHGYFLRTQMLFHGHRVVGATFDCGVVADDHTVDTTDPPNACDHPRPWCVAVVHAVRRQWAEL